MPDKDKLEAELAIVQKFYDEVCALAEENMLKTLKLEGMHYAAMKTVLEKMRKEAGESNTVASKKTRD